MKLDDFLTIISPHVGGEVNISRATEKDNVFYLFIKDVGIINIREIEKIEGVVMVELNRSKLLVSFNENYVRRIILWVSMKI